MADKMKTIIIVLGLLSLFSVDQAKSIDAGCSIRINNDLPEPQPLLLIPGGSKDGHGFYLPEGADGVVTMATGESVLFACPGNYNNFKNANLGIRTILATCDFGTRFFVNLTSYNFSNFACSNYAFHTARYSGRTCYDNIKRHIEIGFEVDSYFYRLMDVCFDDVLYTTLYAKATVVSGIAGFQRTFTQKSFTPGTFFSGMPVDHLYSKNTQRNTISALLNSTQLGDKYINQTSNYYFLARGQLAAGADFVYDSQQSATYYFVNVAPQWQIFNGGNWKSLEESVRAYADRNKLDLEVYTGTYGVATLPNITGVETELYLNVNINNNNTKAIPVPKFYWKAVYDPKSQAGVVFVGINNPYINNTQGDYLICTDVCSKISWVRWDPKNITGGYSYCCEVDDFRSKVQYLPQFTVSSLLTEDDNGNGVSPSRLSQCFYLLVLMAGILKFL